MMGDIDILRDHCREMVDILVPLGNPNDTYGTTGKWQNWGEEPCRCQAWIAETSASSYDPTSGIDYDASISVYVAPNGRSSHNMTPLPARVGIRLPARWARGSNIDHIRPSLSVKNCCNVVGEYRYTLVTL